MRDVLHGEQCHRKRLSAEDGPIRSPAYLLIPILLPRDSLFLVLQLGDCLLGSPGNQWDWVFQQ